MQIIIFSVVVADDRVEFSVYLHLYSFSVSLHQLKLVSQQSYCFIDEVAIIISICELKQELHHWAGPNDLMYLRSIEPKPPLCQQNSMIEQKWPVYEMVRTCRIQWNYYRWPNFVIPNVEVRQSFSFLFHFFVVVYSQREFRIKQAYFILKMCQICKVVLLSNHREHTEWRI